MPRIVASRLNEFADPAVVAITATTEDFAWPVANLRSPARPYEPWRSTGTLITTPQTITIDRGSVSPLGYLGLSRLNVASILLRTWDVTTPPPYTTNVTVPVSRCPLTRRFNLGYVFPTAFSCRWCSITFTAQAPQAESLNTAEPGALLGGLWGGQILYPPQNPLFDVTWTPVDPRRRAEPDSRSTAPRNHRSGYPYVRITLKLRPRSDWRRPFVGTDLRTYAEYVQLLNEAGVVAWFENAGDSSMAFVMQTADEESAWLQDRLRRASGQLTLEEMT